MIILELYPPAAPCNSFETLTERIHLMPFKRSAQKLARKLGCLGHQEPEEQATEPTAIQPGPEPDEEQAVETGRPYRDIVEAEARQYWQEITKVDSLMKPVPLNMYDILPIRQDAMHSAIARNNYALAEVEAMQPGPEPDLSRDIDTGRPYQAFVESEARRYWQEMGKEHNLLKPVREEIRAAATPILCQALSNRGGDWRHQAVDAVVMYALEKGWIKRRFAGAYASLPYIDALIRLAYDANLLAWEIPLPDHPPPRHPPIYYTLYSRHGRPVPVPREDAIIRGDYLYKKDGSRVTGVKDIYPMAFLPGAIWRSKWSNLIYPETRAMAVNQVYLHTIAPVYYGLTFERAELPANRRGVYVWFDWKEETGGTATYHSSQLRDFPYPSDLVFSPHPPKH